MILLLGKSGALGSAFYNVFLREGVSFVAPGRGELDLLDRETVVEFLGRNSFAQIVNCAAYTKVDEAEGAGRQECWEVNVESLKPFLEAGIPMVHFSTDYIFGHFEAGRRISENDERSPLNFYGESKLAAERLLENSGTPFWNIRTSWLFGAGGNDFVSVILGLAAETNKLKIVSDQVGRPTYIPDLVEFVFEHFIKNIAPPGHYHLQNTGDVVSWAEFAEYFLGKSGWGGRVERISSDEFGAIAQRPQNSVLENTRIEEGLRDWKLVFFSYFQ